jgi:PPOX class probable F420-dependent enzyme
VSRLEIGMTPEEVEEFLAPPRVGVLSSNGPDGYPHSAAMAYVPVGVTIRMWSYAKAAKTRNLRRDPRCAFLVEDGELYHELRGVLLRGRIEIVEDVDAVAEIGLALRERQRVSEATVVGAPASPEEVRAQAAKRVGLVLRPERVHSWDHGKIPQR